MLATRGFIDISVGRYEEANRTFNDLAAIAAESGLLEPGLFRYHGDAIEAKIALGRLDEAAELLSSAAARAEALDRPWLRLIVGRGRGTLDAARGSARRCHRGAGGRAGRRSLPPTLRTGGAPNSRSGRCIVATARSVRHATRSTAAASDFERLGARLWLERARSELARVGGRAPSDELTATERQVAELIAAGRTLPRGGGGAVHQPQDGAMEPVEGVQQARDIARGPSSPAG